MRMKRSLALGSRKPLSLEAAQGCLASNLALPGLGSVMAGRPSGYVQLLLAAGAMALTAIFGGRFIYWALAHWADLYGPQADPAEALLEIWQHVRWAFLGFVFFGVSWLWSLETGRRLVQESKKNAPKAEAPPRLR